MYTATVSSRGQVVIPVEARKKLNIKEGDLLLVQVEEDARIIMKPARKKSRKEGIVEKTSGLLKDMEMDGLEYVENLRRNSGRRLDAIEGHH